MNVLSKRRDSVQVVPGCPVTNPSFTEGAGYSKLHKSKAPVITELLLWQFLKCLSKCSWCYPFLKNRRRDLQEATI